MADNIMTKKDYLYGEDKKIKTMVMAGYDIFKDDRGISWLGEEVIERQHNKIVTGGAVAILKLLFGAIAPNVNITTLNQLMNIGENAIVKPGESNIIGLFNIGLGGCGAAYSDEKVVLDQENVVPEMIPFRVVDSISDIGNSSQYWFCKDMPDGKKAFYLKSFEGTPEIHCLFKDAITDGEDGTEITGNPASYSRTDGVETFVEIILRIAAKDLREYFELYDDPQYPRFNSIGLCMGTKGMLPTGEDEIKDAIQFSVLNFSNEMLHFDKDLSIIYRVYVS